MRLILDAASRARRAAGRGTALGIATAALLCGTALVAAQSPHLPAAQAVVFASLDPTLGRLVPGTLHMPDGAGPFPAVVLLHGCSGIGASTRAWAAWLASHGYAALVADSMAPRDVRPVCVVGGHPTIVDQALDAYGGLAYLRAREMVDPRRIGVMGWSHGGGAALDAVNRRYVTSVHPASDGFHAAAAFYPPCRVFPAGGITAPLLMLLGSADDWTPPGQCESSAPTLRARGAPIEWHVYYGATHAFDAPAPDRVLHVAGRTFHLRYDSAAADDAHARVLAFFGEHLK